MAVKAGYFLRVMNMDERINNMMSEYFSTKDLARRNTILKKFAVQYPEGAKDFFIKRLKKSGTLI